MYVSGGVLLSLVLGVERAGARKGVEIWTWGEGLATCSEAGLFGWRVPRAREISGAHPNARAPINPDVNM